MDRNHLYKFRQLEIEEVALLAEGVDRNYFAENWYREMPMSPSSRRAWIEIVFFSGSYIKVYVALLAEGVDRNRFGVDRYKVTSVALLAEGVDRNIRRIVCKHYTTVALLAEGVDRNNRNSDHKTTFNVALLAEGVDRNRNLLPAVWTDYGRPPRGGRG